MNFKTFVFIFSLGYVSGYKILMIAPHSIRSLNILGVAYVRHLLNAGHEVTYVSPFPLRDKLKNFTQIDLSTTNSEFWSADAEANIGYLISKPLCEDTDPYYIQTTSTEVAEAMLQNTEMKALLDDPTVKFDAVICDYVETEIYAALAAYYECPMIWAYSLGAHWFTLRLVDGTTNPAHSSDYLSPDVPPLHSMAERVNKLWLQIKWNYYKWFKTVPREKSYYEKTFAPLFSNKNKPLPNYYELMYNASLVLANDFPGNGLIPSTPQNFIFIGVNKPANIFILSIRCPQQLKTLLDNATNGFIYFSMGSLWKGKDVPKNVTKGLVDLFGSLKQTVIWKYEEYLPNLPKNVHTLKWAPQQSILAHPKCLFFISHGGLLSTTESVHFGVPTIGIPLYFDQFNNVNRGVLAGRTIKVDLTINLVTDLRVAVQKMLRDSSYKQRAKEVSKIYHDRPVSPGAELVHWVEHVVRTRGAPHLRSPALMLPWYQNMYIDVILVCLAMTLLIGWLCKKYLFASLRRKLGNKKEKRN
ncbi:UDP-glucosyltransferase 2-like [Leguminivora glycinivorella]|uniref:UDP-glucosyltransferase 2-like n=1 Tax=Leguminivora glycinivorella TaxID=1035111 RepID=UPI00200C4602|nr:UDP-glucosyltransferase 2-like [Leguminivora glycinivorella]